MNFANVLTLGRFVLAGLFVICLSAPFAAADALALALFVLAALTDALDGYLARRIYGCSDFGRLMDPLADKVLTAAAFIGFVEIGVLPAWMVTLILAREMMVTGLRLLAADKGKVLAAGRWGKHKTVWQMVFIIAVLLAGVFGLREGLAVVLWWCGLAVTAITLWSGGLYFRQNIRRLQEAGRPAGSPGAGE